MKRGPKIVDPEHYPCGHDRTPENTVTRTVRGCPSRTCRTCERARNRAYLDREDVRRYRLESRRARRQAQRAERAKAAGQKRRPWIVPTSPDYDARWLEAVEAFKRAMTDPLRKKGRPRRAA